VLKEHPKSALAHVAMAETLRRAERYEDAYGVILDGTTIGAPGREVMSGLADAHFNRAAAAYKDRQYQMATAHYRRVV
jgi:hypothetical protein